MFGRYRIEGLLGRGGMGVVHRAHDTEQDRVVALKRLSMTLADDESKARFRRESRIAAELRAPHVTTIHDYGEIDGQLYLAMRLVTGTDLRRALEDGPLDPVRAMRILTQAATALDAAHAAGVVHRDVKPSNILLDEDDTAYLADFGIAKSLSPDATRVTRSGEIGTLDYMAPERLMDRPADHRADVYALACVLFECLTGRKPFPADDSAGKLAAQLNDPPPAPSLFDWRIPRAVDLVVATGMDKDPDRRYPTAGELMAAATKAYQRQAATALVTRPELADTPEQGHIMEAIIGVSAGVAATRPPRPDQCPYPGLRSFAPAESDLFHGREQAITDVLVRLSRQTAASGPLLVVGASGTGKSSLLRAGVLPALARARRPWPQLVTTPGPVPVRTLAARLAPLVDADADGLARWLYQRPAEFGRLCTRLTQERGERLVLVVDQFEELFTLAAPRERDAFTTLLSHAWPALVVLAVRADFVDRCLRVPALRAAMTSPYPLGALTPVDLERVITEPARAAGLSIEDGLVDRLITDIGAGDTGNYDPGALPRLAHALRETWQHRTGPVLTLKGYQDTGGVDRAVARTADGVYNGLSEPDRAVLRTALLRMVTVLDGGGVARRRASRAEIPEAVLARLVDARLVTAEADGVQLAHDALLTAWPRLRDWVEQDRQGLVLRQHLGQAAAAWQASGRDEGELYRGARLAATLEWAEDRHDLTPVEQGFLTQSRRARQRTTRRLRGLVTGLGVFLVVALAAGALAAVKWGDATDSAEAAAREARTARSRQLAAESLAQAATDPAGAMRKALEAWRASPTTQARGALLSSSTYTAPVTFETGLANGFSVDVSPDGRYLAAGSQDGEVVVLDTTTGEPLDADLAGRSSMIYDLEFSPDGSMLATVSTDAAEGVRIWEMPGGRELGSFAAAGFAVWRPDGAAVAAIGAPDDVRLAVGEWDPRTGERLGWLTQPYPDSAVVPRDGAYRPDGARFAVGRSDGVVELWDPATQVLAGSHTGHLDATEDRGIGGAPQVFPQVTFAAGALVSASDLDRKLRFADPTTGAPTGKVIDARYLGGDLAATPDDGHLLTVDETTVSIARWSAAGFRAALGDGVFAQGPIDGGIGAFGFLGVAASATGDVAAVQLDGDVVLWPRNPGWHYEPRNLAVRVAFAGDGDRLSAYAVGDPVYGWDPRTGESVPGPHDPAADPFAVGYLPDGTRLVGTRSGQLRLEEPDGRVRAVRITDTAPTQGDIAVAPDGSLIAVVIDQVVAGRTGAQHTMIVLDAETLERRALLHLGAGTVATPVFSPDGDTLLTAVNPTSDAPRPDTEVRRWRTEDFTPLRSIALGEETGNAILTPDGASLAVASDNTVQIRDADTGEVRREIGEHPSGVRALAVSPDGRFLATGTVSDPIIRVFDFDTGTQVAALTGHDGGINHLVFSPDGGLLASASVDTDVGVWTMDPDTAVRQVCERLARAGAKNLPDLGCPR